MDAGSLRLRVCGQTMAVGCPSILSSGDSEETGLGTAGGCENKKKVK